MPLDTLKDFSSFLPISNVKCVAKAIEKALAFKTCWFISNSNLEELHVYQFAYKPNHALINKAVL